MEGRIHLKPSQRKTLLNVDRKTTNPAIRLRAHILLLLAEGYTWSLIAAMLYTSTHTIHRLAETTSCAGPQRPRLCPQSGQNTAKVRTFLSRWGHRIVLHFLPKYAPHTNPIERVWWHLHEEITRNHRCQTIEELIELTFQWIGCKKTFAIETSIYPHAAAA